MTIHLLLPSGNNLTTLRVKQVPRLQEMLIYQKQMFQVISVIYDYDLNQTQLIVNPQSSRSRITIPSNVAQVPS